MQVPKIGEIVDSFNKLRFGDTFVVSANTANEYIFCGIMFDDGRSKVIARVVGQDRLTYWYTTDYRNSTIYRTNIKTK